MKKVTIILLFLFTIVQINAQPVPKVSKDTPNRAKLPYNPKYFKVNPYDLYSKLTHGIQLKYPIGEEGEIAINSDFYAYQLKGGIIVYYVKSKAITQPGQEFRGGLMVRIDFFDKKTKQLINSYDVIKHNRYFKECGSKIRYYVLPQEEWATVDYGETPDFDPKGRIAYYCVSSEIRPSSSIGKNFLIFNEKVGIDNNNRIVETRNDIIGLDSTGKVLMKLKELKLTDIMEAEWSSNGKYLCLHYGGNYNVNQIYPNTFELWDAVEPKLIIKEKTDIKECVGIEECIPNLIQVSFAGTPKGGAGWEKYDDDIFLDAVKEVYYRGYKTDWPTIGENPEYTLDGVFLIFKNKKTFFKFSSFLKEFKITNR